MARYFENGVATRLAQIVATGDTMLDSTAKAIDRRTRQLILLSKDVENASASVNLSNREFHDWATGFHLNASDFDSLSIGMHREQMEVILRQNELDLLNQLLLKSGHSPSLMTAH
jgi:hypothetical protein